MCYCSKPVKNGEPGYSWDGKGAGVHPVNAPDAEECETVIYDEPGRCGGLDSHSYHYRVVAGPWGEMALLVRHGGGDERVRLSGGNKTIKAPLASLDSNGRYWLLNAIYHGHSDARRSASETEAARWRTAAAEKRIKTRRNSKRGTVKVWIEEARPNGQ